LQETVGSMCSSSLSLSILQDPVASEGSGTLMSVSDPE
uniref:Uncharacterized protein n=1 Tax=Amphimedon queenslandica TaxID=400682 RepID=A0A1X7TUF1_AMPQE